MRLQNTPAKAARTTTAMVLLALSAACFELDFPDLSLGPGFGCTDCFTLTFLVTPQEQRILRGDSTLLSIFSTVGHDKATWSIAGDAIGLVRRDGSLDSAITEAENSVRIRALRRGVAFVRARAADGLSDSAKIAVADSADIVAIDVYRTIAPGVQPTVGQEFDLQVYLRDSSQRPYKAAPTAWSVSDTTVVRVTGPLQLYEYGAAFKVRPKKTGAATVTFSFLDLRATVDVSVK